MTDEYLKGFAAARTAAIAVAQRHMEPRLARRLVNAHPDLDGARGGFLLAMGHIRDDLMAMPDPNREPK